MIYHQPRPKVKPGRYIFRCRRKACGHAWRIDYPEANAHTPYRTHAPAMRKGWGTPQTISTPNSDAHQGCPACGAEYPHCQRIRGVTVADIPCDARCTSAKGFMCSCSCGGKNHGSEHAHY